MLSDFPGIHLFSPHFSGKLILGYTSDVNGENNYALHSTTDREILSQTVERRKELTQQLNMRALITLKQVHGSRIHRINEANVASFAENPAEEGDGLITGLPGVLLGILTADCVPVLYSADGDNGKNIVAAAHAGWRGVHAGIHTAMVRELKERENIPPENIQVWLGPHICSCCYEVGKEVVEQFPEPVVRQDRGKLFLDLEAMIRRDLIEMGIADNGIFSTGYCSFCHNDPAFYSYRRGHIWQRMLNFIGIQG